MTKRNTQTSTVVVPATVAHTPAGAAPAAKANVAAEIEVKADAKQAVAKVEAAEAAPVAETMVIAAGAAPAGV
jgi:hypothetical protein